MLHRDGHYGPLQFYFHTTPSRPVTYSQIQFQAICKLTVMFQPFLINYNIKKFPCGIPPLGYTFVPLRLFNLFYLLFW